MITITINNDSLMVIEERKTRQVFPLELASSSSFVTVLRPRHHMSLGCEHLPLQRLGIKPKARNSRSSFSYFLAKMLLLCGVLLVVCGRLGAGAQDVTDGMNCVTQEDFQYCEGKSDSYNKLANEAQDGGLNTRIMGGQNDLLTRNYGMSSPSSCDPNYSQKCQQVSASILPTYLVNGRNQGRYILQMGAFQQTVALAVCTGNKVCGLYGFCEQNYVNVQLLSWDPNVRYPVLIVDHFRVPSCCKCQRGGSRPGGPWRWD